MEIVFEIGAEYQRRRVGVRDGRNGEEFVGVVSVEARNKNRAGSLLAIHHSTPTARHCRAHHSLNVQSKVSFIQEAIAVVHTYNKTQIL